jgi:hypothetical protein
MPKGIHISPDFEINESYLRVANAVKQSILCKFLWFLKVINLRGNFEGLNDVFIQSKPAKIECTKVQFSFADQIKELEESFPMR